MPKQPQKVKARNNAQLTLFSLTAIVIGMFCLAYAAVPLYNLFCRVTGFGGTTQVAVSQPTEILDRKVTVLFNADVNPGLNWEFYPLQRKVDIKVGESKLIFFKAKNLGGESSTGTSIYNVTPNKVGAYFNKIECFCFEKQKLASGEEMEFPVSFFIDPSITEEKNLNDIQTITLSYTFFKVKDS